MSLASSSNVFYSHASIVLCLVLHQVLVSTWPLAAMELLGRCGKEVTNPMGKRFDDRLLGMAGYSFLSPPRLHSHVAAQKSYLKAVCIAAHGFLEYEEAV